MTPRGGRNGASSQILRSSIEEHRLTLDQLAEQLVSHFAEAVGVIDQCFRGGGMLLACGNGGSAADAQHFAAELVGQCPPRRALALTTDTSALTAIANDQGYPRVFAQQVAALARPGDVLVAISTSGCSENVLAAVSEAHSRSVLTIGLTGARPQPLADTVDLCLAVPSRSVARIQECHALLLHSLWTALNDES